MVQGREGGWALLPLHWGQREGREPLDGDDKRVK